MVIKFNYLTTKVKKFSTFALSWKWDDYTKILLLLAEMGLIHFGSPIRQLAVPEDYSLIEPIVRRFRELNGVGPRME
jgi:hypothetical protein